jgi:two-component system cell cycle sensor histidine kinase/response regulator CckA
MDGAQTLAALREIKPDVRVVLSSGFMRGYQAEDLMARGVREFLQKPYRKSQLSEKVADALAD